MIPMRIRIFTGSAAEFTNTGCFHNVFISQSPTLPTELWDNKDKAEDFNMQIGFSIQIICLISI